MFFLANGLGFGYSELMNMEHIERLKWVDMLSEHNKERTRENERQLLAIKNSRR